MVVGKAAGELMSVGVGEGKGRGGELCRESVGFSVLLLSRATQKSERIKI